MQFYFGELPFELVHELSSFITPEGSKISHNTKIHKIITQNYTKVHTYTQ